LQDLVVGELNAVKQHVAIDKFPFDNPEPTKETYRERVERMEVICSRLVPMVAAGAYWGGPKWDALWRRCAVGLSRVEHPGGRIWPAWKNLQVYPAALVLYGAGLAATARENYRLLKSLLLDPIEFEERDPRPSAGFLGSTFVIDDTNGQLLYDQEPKTKKRTPGSDWLVKQLQPMLANVELGGKGYPLGIRDVVIINDAGFMHNCVSNHGDGVQILPSEHLVDCR
jgi:hypothetical protein